MFIQIFTTVARKSEAEKIAKILLDKKIAACVQISSSVTSLFFWENKIEKSKEYVVGIKTGKNLYKEVEKVIQENHSYELPEIISIEISGGSKKYFDWMKNALKK